MNTIKCYLAESGRVIDIRKDFPLFQGQFQNVLLNVFVPTSLLNGSYSTQHYIAQVKNDGELSDVELAQIVSDYTPSHREAENGDIVDLIDISDESNDYYRYIFNGTAWTSAKVDNFSIANLEGTSVKIGCIAVERNGVVKKSQTYYMRYLKTITLNLNGEVKEYALYERSMPKVFTALEGQGQNAVTMVVNVVNVVNAKVTMVATSQTATFDVLPSTILDKDEAEEASELESLTAEMNGIKAELDLKQSKYDEDIAVEGESTIVGALNNLDGRVTDNAEGIDDNATSIASLGNRITQIENSYTTGEDYIGTMEVSEDLPTASDLSDFATEQGKTLKNGSVIIVELEKSGATDEAYKYIFNGATWGYYKIPPMEKAGNGSAGIVEGTYGVGDTTNTLVNITGGKIVGVYTKNANGTYSEIATSLNGLKADIADIKDGTQVVGEATKATKDGGGNVISTTYLTRSNGATKEYVQGYALPRTFNDTLFLTADGYDTTAPTESEGEPIFEETSTSIGETELAVAEYELDDITFELSKKNGFANRLYVSADNTEIIKIKVETYAIKDETDTLLSVEVSNDIELSDIFAVTFNGVFSQLGEDVIHLEGGDKIKQVISVIRTESTENTFGIWSDSVGASTLNLEVGSVAMRFVSAQLAYMETPTAENVGEIVQYVGASDSVYTNGFFYKGVGNETDGYEWAEVPTGGIKGSKYISVDMEENGTELVVELDETEIGDLVGTAVTLTGIGDNGTLTDAELTKLLASKKNYIVYDNEYYYLADDQQASGYVCYTHCGRDNTNNTNIKTIYVYTDDTSVLYLTWARQSLSVQAKMIKVTATLETEDWTSVNDIPTLSLSVTGVTENDIGFLGGATDTDNAALANANIRCETTNGGVTFIADSTPTADIDIVLTILRG